MDRESFIFYRGFSECIKELDKEVRCDCYEALIDYALDGTEPEENGIVMAVFKAFKAQIDANNRRYENGQKGGRPKNQTETKTKPNNNQTETKPKPNVNVNVNDNVNDIKKEKEKKKNRSFEKPSLQAVADYCQERQNNVDAQTFVDFYEAKGWMIGKEKMKDWKAAVRTWERRDRASPPKQNAFNTFQQNTYTEEELEKLLAN